ncbi:MAG: response regulator [Lachnospiraceae bacterium]|nr:response regulator [Lachnospiraceae bacterium]
MMYRAYLVDDDRFILEELTEIIPWMENGFEVIGSNTDPERAMGEILELGADAVFCDMRMPKMDGNEMIARLRESGCGAEFVVISAYDDFENVRAFFQQDGFDYILKPVDIDDVRIVLEKLNSRLSENRLAESGSVTDNPGFNSLVKYVDDSFTEKITLSTLAEKFGFSRNYICALFQKYYNQSLSIYLTEKRMKYAGELINDKTLLIKQVGIMCGYTDYYHFFKVFKNYYGVSPKEMRNTGEQEDL